jgi:hypothetical protein
MSSKIEVNQIAAATGSTITLVSGQTLDLSSGTVTLPSTALSALNASNLTSGTVPSARLSLTSSDLPTIPTTKGGTGLTTLGTAGQALKVNSGATGLEFGSVSSAVLQIVELYRSSTSNYFSGQAGTNLSGTTYYPIGARIGGTFTKQSGTSKLLVMGHYNLMHSPTNLHGTVLWVAGSESSYINLGVDGRVFGWNGSGYGPYSHSYQSILTVVASGSKTIYYAPAVDGTRTHTHELNPNPQSNSVATYGDAPNKLTTSTMTVIEFE